MISSVTRRALDDLFESRKTTQILSSTKINPCLSSRLSGDNETYALTSLDDPGAIARLIAAIFVRSRGMMAPRSLQGLFWR